MRQHLLIGILLLMTLLFSGCNLTQKPQSKQSSEQSQAGVTLEGVPVGNMTAEEIKQIVMRIAEAKNQAPINAGFQPNAAGVMQEKNGETVNVERTVQAVLAAQADTALNPVIVEKKPIITSEKLKTAQLVGQAETPLLDRGEARMHNIRVAAHNLTNTIIQQGETFSFNKTIGNTTLERGYRVAPIIEEGQTTSGLGGGVCQISSTLYKAILAGNLPVVERHAHSKPVDYIAEGMDATTSDDKDFKFRNNRHGLLILHVLVTANAVRTDIWELPKD